MWCSCHFPSCLWNSHDLFCQSERFGGTLGQSEGVKPKDHNWKFYNRKICNESCLKLQLSCQLFKGFFLRCTVFFVLQPAVPQVATGKVNAILPVWPSVLTVHPCHRHNSLLLHRYLIGLHVKHQDTIAPPLGLKCSWQPLFLIYYRRNSYWKFTEVFATRCLWVDAATVKEKWEVQEEDDATRRSRMSRVSDDRSCRSRCLPQASVTLD